MTYRSSTSDGHLSWSNVPAWLQVLVRVRGRGGPGRARAEGRDARGAAGQGAAAARRPRRAPGGAVPRPTHRHAAQAGRHRPARAPAQGQGAYTHLHCTPVYTILWLQQYGPAGRRGGAALQGGAAGGGGRGCGVGRGGVGAGEPDVGRDARARGWVSRRYSTIFDAANFTHTPLYSHFWSLLAF